MLRLWSTTGRLSSLRFLSTSAAARNHDMFCMQCEQTENGTGCTVVGVCGKTPEVAALQDALVHNLKGISQYAHRARELGAPENPELNRFTHASLFATMTNVNFDPQRFRDEYIPESLKHLESAKSAYTAACKDKGVEVEDLTGTPATTSISMVEDAPEFFKVEARKEMFGSEVTGLQELVTYGLKGLGAYSAHAKALGQEDDEVYAATHELLSLISNNDTTSKSSEALLGAALKVGKANLRVMEMLDTGHTTLLGDPVPTQVKLTPRPGKCLLVSGHDLHDLKDLLEQSKDSGVQVYTHGEMLPAHSYPELQKYDHFAGHYGGPWQLQKFEFRKFPGPIVVTTNCLIEPRKSYADRLYSCNVVGWPGVKHIESDASGKKNFSAAIAQAQECEGFVEGKLPKVQPESITIGFGRNTVLNVADKVVDGVKTGAITRVFVIGGCDGNEGERNYFKELAQGTPDSSLILTLGCGKYRFNRLDFGTVPNNGLPRLLDMGQCNDAYGAIVVASELAKAFNLDDINKLPLSFALSWFEQKAVAVLLSLLSLGVKNIAIGPAMPAFVGPEAGKYLADNLGLRQVNLEHVDQDLEKFVA
eukprot:m.45539 g.45539  ORF g.45539 m.45539 type:complete len:591 (+) comp17417_c0_seq2:258-2030(+)